jgi:hypothetical protein
MRVLVACEYSGRVRDAFRAKGHDAVSCDLLPTEVPGPHHQGDVRDILADGWDLMIAHPECTYLCNSGVRWLHSDPTRWARMEAGAEFFRLLLNAVEAVPRIAVENPVMHKHAAKLVGAKATQFVQPYMFGETQSKRTGLWLRNLPPLVPTNDVKAETMALPVAQRSAVHYASPGPERWRDRSRTFQGLADAMADQWGVLA